MRNGRSSTAILDHARQVRNPALIVDVKMRSPRDGVLIQPAQFDSYVEQVLAGKPDALSMPTDSRHFGGSIDLARRLRAATDLPLFRKEYFRSVDQIDESAEAGFDAVQLTLATIPDSALLARMYDRAVKIGLEVVVGVHTSIEARKALDLQASIIGLNNRDITALELDDGTIWNSETVLAEIPDSVFVISESSLRDVADVIQATKFGAVAVLIGTAVATSPDPTAMLRELRRDVHQCLSC